MSGLVGSSLGFALLAGVATTLFILAWPRRVSAEDWVLRRRSAERSRGAPPRADLSRWRLRVPRRWVDDTTYRQLAQTMERDLRIARVAGPGVLPETASQLASWIGRAAFMGAVAGTLIGVIAWRLGLAQAGWAVSVIFALVGAGGAALLQVRSVRTKAARSRAAVNHRLPRVITGARMVMESGAATPEGALAMAVSLYADPAADLLREAIRLKEVHKMSLEDALDQVGQRYGLEPFGQLADAFRIGRRYGTRLSDILGNFAQELRREWYAAYRERITRAPVLMTIPALFFFVVPLLFLILFLVFTPLFTVLSQL